MITFTPNNNLFLRSWKVLPYVELKDITMKYTRNANFVISNADTFSISNVYLEGLSVKDVTITYPIFYFNTGHSMIVNNLTAKNVAGPLFYASNVLAQTFSSFFLNKMYASQDLLKSTLQSIIMITKVGDPSQKGLDIRKSQDTAFDNINLNGYTSIEGTDYTKRAENTYLIEVHTVYGK